VLHMIPSPSHEHERIAMILGRLLGPLGDAAGLDAAPVVFSQGNGVTVIV